MELPRFLVKWWANLNGYFWLPCPICGKNFAGFEWGETLYDTPWSGRGTCPNCREETLRRNKEFFEKWDKENPGEVV